MWKEEWFARREAGCCTLLKKGERRRPLLHQRGPLLFVVRLVDLGALSRSTKQKGSLPSINEEKWPLLGLHLYFPRIGSSRELLKRSSFPPFTSFTIFLLLLLPCIYSFSLSYPEPIKRSSKKVSNRREAPLPPLLVQTFLV